ncbi:hypothetical protein NHQ30_011335 [Ciborinia camelliae]|nr:hypothetical protein NHQ30_011335 [Ciborinia camelliae]
MANDAGLVAKRQVYWGPLRLFSIFSAVLHARKLMGLGNGENSTPPSRTGSGYTPPPGRPGVGQITLNRPKALNALSTPPPLGNRRLQRGNKKLSDNGNLIY